MKEFEKWFNKKQDPEEILRLEACITPENLTDMIAETAWRAALEWMLTQETSVCYSLPVILTDIIRKELDEN